MDRKLAVVFAADIAGYSRLMEADEEGTFAALHECRRVLDRYSGEHGGRIFSSAGDSVVAEFSSPVEAVRCALDVRDELGRLNESRPADRHVELRIGINLGDVMVDGENLLGDGVNVAARLQVRAQPGGIVVSDSVYRHARGRLPVTGIDCGLATLKNRSEPVHVYEIVKTGERASSRRTRGRSRLQAAIAVVVALLVATSAAWIWHDRQEVERAGEVWALPAEPSIAVLPFVTLGGGPQHEAISDGITNDLITDLSKLSGLFVISSNSSFAMKGKQMLAQEIGRALGVRYLLEGSLQLGEDKLRLNTQLIDATSGRHIWADRYEQPAEASFTVQDQIVRSIVGTLAVKVTAEELERAMRRGAENMDAIQLRNQAREIFDDPERWTQEWWNQARDWLDQALKIDPGYAQAIGDLAYVHWTYWTNDWGDNPEGSLDLATKLAEQAVALDPDNYDLHWTLGIVYMSRPENFAVGLAAYAEAKRLNPNDPDLLAEYGEALIVDGRSDQAIETVQQALAREPIDHPYWYSLTLAKAYYMTGEYRQAITTMNAINPLPDNTRLISAASYAQLGDATLATAEIAKFLAAEPEWTIETAAESVFRKPADLAHWLDGLRKAGLPENGKQAP